MFNSVVTSFKAFQLKDNKFCLSYLCWSNFNCMISFIIPSPHIRVPSLTSVLCRSIIEENYFVPTAASFVLSHGLFSFISPLTLSVFETTFFVSHYRLIPH